MTNRNPYKTMQAWLGHNFRQTRQTGRIAAFAVMLITLSACNAPSQGALIITYPTTTGNLVADSSNLTSTTTTGLYYFDIDLKNGTPDALTVDGFSVTVTLSNNTGTGTAAFNLSQFDYTPDNYIFSGSIFGPIVSILSTDTLLITSDISPINPGTSFASLDTKGLVRVYIDITDSATPDISAEVSLSTVTNAVPEPSNLAAGLTGAALGLIVLWRTRRSAAALPMPSS